MTRGAGPGMDHVLDLNSTQDKAHFVKQQQDYSRIADSVTQHI